MFELNFELVHIENELSQNCYWLSLHLYGTILTVLDVALHSEIDPSHWQDGGEWRKQKEIWNSCSSNRSDSKTLLLSLSQTWAAEIVMYGSGREHLMTQPGNALKVRLSHLTKGWRCLQVSLKDPAFTGGEGWVLEGCCRWIETQYMCLMINTNANVKMTYQQKQHQVYIRTHVQRL